MTSPLRVGLVGYGLFGRHHAAAVETCPEAELTAICAASASSREEAAAAHPSAAICDSFAELAARDDVDLVDVVVPNHLHYDVARQAIAAGKHLLLEKPMALSTHDCDELLRLASENSVRIAVNHELRLSSLWGGVKRLIDDGSIGRPRHALIELSRFPYRQGSQGWRYDPARVGDWILEEPIHFFDLARWYLGSEGEPESVYARASGADAERPDLLDNFSAIVNFPGGAYAVVSQTLAAFEHHVTAKIAGERGTIWAHWSAADARSDSVQFGLRWGRGDAIHEETFDRTTGELLELADQIAAVCRAIHTGDPFPCEGVDGRWSTRLCLAARQSVDEQRSVGIESDKARG